MIYCCTTADGVENFYVERGGQLAHTWCQRVVHQVVGIDFGVKVTAIAGELVLRIVSCKLRVAVDVAIKFRVACDEASYVTDFVQ